MEILASRVLLRPRDFATSLHFYEQTLGLHRFREFGAPGHRGIVFFLGGAYLELSEAGEPALADPAGIRLWLQVRDLNREFDTLTRRAPGSVVIGPEAKPWGLNEATVRDPDGLELVLVEVPAEHPLRRDTR